MRDLPLVVRTFVAIDVPEELKQAIHSLQRSLANLGEGKIAWPRPEGIHLTLKFLGDVDRDKIGEVIDSVRTAVRGRRNFPLKTTIRGGFPRVSQPRTLWVGVDGGEPLLDLHQAIDLSMYDAGFPIEEGTFRPHLTVGRVKFLDKASIVPARFADLPWKDIQWMAGKINVMASRLKPTGAEYQVIDSVPFE